MKIAAVICTKNESDVIEAFVRHNSVFCDAFFITDMSNDKTREILGSLQNEGFDITVFNNPLKSFEQAILVNSMVQHVNSLNRFDWIIFLDADEILSSGNRDDFEKSLNQVPNESIPSIKWKTFIPTSTAYFDYQDPIVQGFLPRTNEGPNSPIQKVLLPQRFFSYADMAVGNHHANDRRSGYMFHSTELPFSLGHFPVRSAEQIIARNLIAIRHLSIKETRTPIEGWHIFNTHKQLLNNGFHLDYDAIKEIALSYAIEEFSTKPTIDHSGDPIRKEPLAMKYHHLRSSNVAAALDKELEQSSIEILRYKQQLRMLRGDLDALATQVSAIRERMA